MLLIVAILFLAYAALAQPPAAPNAAPTPQAAQASNEPGMDLVGEARRLTNQGKYDEAIAKCQEAVGKNPKLYAAHAALGVALDLKGDYATARQHLQHAIDLANPQQKPGALRSMAMSYAFEKKAADAARFEQQVIDADLAKQPPDYAGAADVTNELARVYIESGDLKNALQTYRLGWEAIQKKPDLKPEERALWEFRWENAQARIAARRGKKKEAQQHVDAAKAAMERMSAQDKDQQKPFWPYLTGYVAFYNRDYKQALTELQQGNQRDPFVLVLEAQAYEKSGDQDKAMETYRKVLEINAHNPTGAFSRPLARQKLAGAS